MPFFLKMKIQPVDFVPDESETIRTDLTKPVSKSRLKRLFDLQFTSVLRITSSEKVVSNDVSKDEASSVCLDKLVQNFIEDNNSHEKPQTKYVRCNCFTNSNNNKDSSDDELDFPVVDSDPADVLKSLIRCENVMERNLLAETSKIVEKFKFCKPKDDLRKIVKEELSSLGYNASIRISIWEKSPSYPAGEYEYLDVVIEDDERLIIDIDFRSEFEIARSTGSYKNVLQVLPYIYVGKPDKLQRVVLIVAEEARLSLKKKGMHFPPWRKAEYMKAKWLSPYDDVVKETKIGAGVSKDDKEMLTWKPPVIKRSCEKRGEKAVTGLAFLLKENP